MNFSDKLRDARLAKGLRQKDIADKLGMTIKAYGFYELGQREPSLSSLRIICDYLDVSADYLIGRTDY